MTLDTMVHVDYKPSFIHLLFGTLLRLLEMQMTIQQHITCYSWKWTQI